MTEGKQKQVRWWLVVLTVVIIFVALGALMPIPTARSRDLARRTQCQSNLHSLDIALQGYCYPPVESYPMDLWDLDPHDISQEAFLCPGAGSVREGTELSLSNISRYADIIYVSGLSPKCPADIPVILCPPINHGGKGGNVLFGSHSTRWVLPEEFEAVTDRMYAYAQSNGLRVVVSEALTKRSRGRYTPRP